MARDPLDPLQLARLCENVRRSGRSLERFRTNKKEMVEQYVGPRWSEESARFKDIIVNLVDLYVSVVGKALIPKNPRVMFSTFSRELKPTVSAMQAWANRQIEKMDLQHTLHRCVVDALFSIGICKVALATPAESAGSSWALGAGQPFCEPIDLDDFRFDPNARRLNAAAWLGHRLRVPREAAIKVYGKKMKDVPAADDLNFNQEGDERLSVLGRGYQGDQKDYEDMVDLWEIYLARERLVVCLIDDAGSPAPIEVKGKAQPLHVQRWLGPDSGPYHFLSYGLVPGNAMPKGPVQAVFDLHLNTNRTMRKLQRQIDRVKDNTFVEGSAIEDADRLRDANDGDIIPVRRPEAIREVTSGGKSVQALQAMAMYWQQLFNKMGGNLDLLGGQGPQSPTLGQDKMLNENAGATIADKQDTTVAFTSRVLNAMGWYWWHDPHQVQQTEHKVGSASIVREVHPAGSGAPLERHGRYEDLDITVDPYSLQHSTPQTRLQGLMTAVSQIYMPMAGIAQQQGIAFDFNAFFKKVGQYMDQPDLTDIFTVMEPPPPSPGGDGGGDSTMPASTTRNYVRESKSQRTQEGTEKDMMQRILAQDPGGDSAA